MYRNACFALVLLLVTGPAMAAGSVVIEGGQKAQSVSAPAVILFGGRPVLVPAAVRDVAYACYEQYLRALPDGRVVL